MLGYCFPSDYRRSNQGKLSEEPKWLWFQRASSRALRTTDVGLTSVSSPHNGSLDHQDQVTEMRCWLFPVQSKTQTAAPSNWRPLLRPDLRLPVFSALGLFPW